jgi:hypothetical protein
MDNASYTQFGCNQYRGQQIGDIMPKANYDNFSGHAWVNIGYCYNFGTLPEDAHPF